MSGYDHIRRETETTKADELEYKSACNRYLCRFCEEFASQSLGVEWGRDERGGDGSIRRSDKDVAYIHPTIFDEESGTVWTRIRVMSKRVEVAVHRLGDTYYINTLKREFTDSTRGEAFQHIKDSIMDESGRRPWLENGLDSDDDDRSERKPDDE